MRLLVLSDLHGAFEKVTALSTGPTGVDGILLCGDLTHFGGARQAQPILTALRELSPSIVAVHGNCDRRSVADLLVKESLSVDSRWAEIAGIPAAGLGGSLPAPIPTPSTYTEEEAGERLASLTEGAATGLPSGEWIFITHQPPFESEADTIGSGKHVGSPAVARFIRTVRPGLVCTGHIHEAYSVSLFGESLLVNPGSLKEGRYAIATRRNGKWGAELFRMDQ